MAFQVSRLCWDPFIGLNDAQIQTAPKGKQRNTEEEEVHILIHKFPFLTHRDPLCFSQVCCFPNCQSLLITDLMANRQEIAFVFGLSLCYKCTFCVRSRLLLGTKLTLISLTPNPSLILSLTESQSP